MHPRKRNIYIKNKNNKAHYDYPTSFDKTLTTTQSHINSKEFVTVAIITLYWSSTKTAAKMHH